MQWSRRKFIVAGGAATLSAGLLTLGVRLYHAGRGPETVLLEVATDLKDLDGVWELGRSWLQNHPRENDREYLLERLTRTGPAGQEIRLTQALARDIDGDELVQVDGWLLPVTEARLYAFAYLLHLGK
jgi:hypothetical protein